MEAVLGKVRLSKSELNVLYYTSHGMTARAIANKLYRGLRTIENTQHRARRKLQAHNNAQAVAEALRRRLID